jgi:hypothetical protein
VEINQERGRNKIKREMRREKRKILVNNKKRKRKGIILSMLHSYEKLFCQTFL